MGKTTLTPKRASAGLEVITGDYILGLNRRRKNSHAQLNNSSQSSVIIFVTLARIFIHKALYRAVYYAFEAYELLLREKMGNRGERDENKIFGRI